MYSKPLASFITFTTYGSWLHGNPKGSIVQNKGTTKLLESHKKLQNYHSRKLSHPPVKLTSSQRKLVLEPIIEHCNVKNWHLLAVHVRSNHVHILVDADKNNLIADFKRWATRTLNAAGENIPKVWTQGGSRQYIFKDNQLNEKIDYIINQQGNMMEYYTPIEAERQKSPD